jgi:predicted aspartyl protease
MTRTTRFDARLGLVYVSGTITGPRSTTQLRLLVDTGAAMSTVVPHVVDEIGYSARDGGARTTVRTALGSEHGYVLRVARFAALGFAMANFPVNVFDLADRDVCDGLIGFNFLRCFNCQIRPKDGCILLENIAPLAS